MKNLKLITFYSLLMMLLAQQTIAQTSSVVGTDAGANNTGSFATLYGYDAGTNNQGGHSIMNGYQAGKNNTGGSNSFLGSRAGKLNTSGFNNTFVGKDAGYGNITGYGNVYVGNGTGSVGGTNGHKNTYVGGAAGTNNSGGNNNVIIGYSAGNSSTGNRNVLIGTNAGANINANDQLYIENSNETDTPLIYGDFASGKVGIETGIVPDGYTFAVNGKALAEEVQVMARTSWPDYVFAKDYQLMPLPELETTIEQLGHLPGVPSAEEVEENGHALGEMDAILLEKVEELTLHLIEMNKQMEYLRERNEVLENRLIKIEKK